QKMYFKCTISISDNAQHHRDKTENNMVESNVTENNTSIDPFFYFDPAALHARAEAMADSYRTASPFPHAVIDKLLPDAIALHLAREFPSADFAGFQRRDNPHQVMKQA